MCLVSNILVALIFMGPCCSGSIMNGSHSAGTGSRGCSVNHSDCAHLAFKIFSNNLAQGLLATIPICLPVTTLEEFRSRLVQT